MILSLLFSLLQLVQQPIPPVQVIDTQSGLSNNIVYETYQDREGFIWIATDNGLNRYDGYDFKIFYHDKDDSTSISSDIIRTIREDKQGNIWIGTFNGLNLYHKDTETFSPFHSLPKEVSNRLDIQQMEFDSEGLLWFNTIGLIGWFDPSSQEFGFADPTYESFSLAIDSEGRAWSGAKKGNFYQYIREQDLWKRITETKQKLNSQLYWGQFSQSLWVEGTVDPQAFPVPIATLPVLPENVFPRELLETDQETLWIGTDAGLFRYHKASNQLEEISLSETSSTLTSSIRSLYQDKNGGIWVGTLNGLFHFDPNQKSFKHLDVSEGNSDVVMGMEVVNTKAYINTLGDRFSIYDLESQKLSGVSFASSPPVGFNFIWDIASVPESDFPIWLATDAGVLLYNPQSGSWKRVKLELPENQAKTSFAIHSFEGDNVWVASHRDIHLLSKETGDVEKNILNDNKFLHSTIQDLEMIGEQLFFSTEGDGVYVYDQGTQKTQSLLELVPNASAIALTPVWDLYAHGATLWIGTNRGLYRLNTDNWTFEQIQADETLINRVIFSIEIDHSGTIWMGTEKGLASYDHEKKKVAYFNANDGVQNTEFNRRSVIKMPNGELWFGGVGGITRFDPSQIRQNKVVPPVHITGVEIITSDSTFTPYIDDGELRLPWYHNTLEVKYVALNYTNPAQNQYQYQLVGHDPDWVKDQDARTARYVRLPAGKYTFKVKGANNDGLWNPETQTMTLVILPPFWETWWFRVAVLLIIVLLLWSLYSYRVKRLLEVEQIKLRIAGDLHDEVGSGLSGIALTGDLLQRQVAKGKPKAELVERITKNARYLASSLDAIVWLIDPQKETLEDLLIKCKSVASELLIGSKLSVIEEIPDTYKKYVLSAEKKRNLFLLVKEGVHNIAKHAGAQEVNLSFVMKAKILEVILKDDGQGFAHQEQKKGHGLGSMQSRGHELGGDFKIVAALGKGTEINLKMKLP